ncbi:tudor domain-containing protein 1-like isoform X1 [Clarias gariepinus]|uniref:tudor domain-containing protein 1-like isoform X1 n=1 Tax=Clarias gariepinus TaxID=13013 RepID=UPI00234C3CE5|nr:tudor domain-containing protein 1-like isoform X1 [Clarias gariepinus]XP_053361306.1 tudor domain-containing protein 1-like isoform X1 [Clarias gariepinus]
MENDKYCMPLDIPGTGSQRKTKESHIQNVTKTLSDHQVGNYLTINHQKQTSSQLIHFLKTKSNVVQLSLSGSEKGSSVLTKSKTVTSMDQGFTALQSTHKKPAIYELNNSVSIFKVKSNNAGSVTYSCITATRSELWDIGYISTEVKNSLQVSTADDSLSSADYKDFCILDSFTQSNDSRNESMASKQMKHQSELEVALNRSVDGVGIPKFQIKKFEEMPVVVTHVVSPRYFYIQRKDNSLQELSGIMAKKDTRSYAELNCIPDIGAYVMAWNAEQELWCRAQVTKICGMNSGNNHLCSRYEFIKNIEVEIRRVDYGDSMCLSLWNIKELCGEVAKIPAQALQVSLADVKPVNGESWSTEAVIWFKEKVNKRTLYARLYPEENGVIVELFMEKGKIGAMRRSSCLSLRLAQNGHARKCMSLKRSLNT